MGKQRKREPRPSWAQTSDKLSGIRRDPNNGIVMAREQRHPMADLFRSVPMGTGLPGMRMPIEAEHLLAIHIFDNLDCSPPQNPVYKARPDKDALRSTGMPGFIWVPIATPDDPEDPAPDEGPVLVADIGEYDDRQIAAMKAQIAEVERQRKMSAQADDGAGGGGGS
uniref:hypothetical protein n=1 Tax=Micromonospora sp. NBC_00855 TaxID=2975978 RepID=UPI00225022C9|nr:hypothetical protein OHB51_35560 [Micromonospora sp. NBC_00855]